MSFALPKMSSTALQQQMSRAVTHQATRTRPYSSFYPKVRVEKKIPRSQRSLNTTKHLNSVHDESTIDFAYMPQDQLSAPAEPESFRVPLLPDNSTPPTEHTNNAHHDFHMESVTRPEITTVSANGTHIDSPSAMSDVTDNHSMINDANVYDLTKKVSNAAAAKWESITGADAAADEGERGVMGELLHSFVDEIFGSKRPARS